MTNKEQAIADEDFIKRAIAIRDLLMEVKDKTGAMMEEIDETQRKTLPRELTMVLMVPTNHLYGTINLLLNWMDVALSKIRQVAAD